MALAARLALRKIEDSGPEGGGDDDEDSGNKKEGGEDITDSAEQDGDSSSGGIVTPDLLWERIQTIYESSANPMPMIYFFDSVLLAKTQRFHLLHHVAVICHKQRELFVRKRRMLGQYETPGDYTSSLTHYNGGRIWSLPKKDENVEKKDDETRIREEFKYYSSAQPKDPKLESKA